MAYEVKTFKLDPKLPKNITSSVLRASQVNAHSPILSRSNRCKSDKSYET